MKLRFGILGCSSISIKSVIPSISDSKFSNVQMIASRSISKAKSTAKLFSCENFGHYEDMLENDEIDAVYISLPIALHEEWATKAAKAGKHVICEKSLCLSYNSAKKLIKLCNNNDLKILEGFSYRFHPQHKKIKELIKKNKLGKINSFRAKFGFTLPYSKKNFRFNKSLGGGVLNDVGCYVVSSSYNIFENLPETIFCNLDMNSHSGVDINGNLYMTYSNGVGVSGSFGYNLPFQSSYELWGSKASVILDRAFNIKKNVPAIIRFDNGTKTKQIQIPPNNQFKTMIDVFCKEVKNPNSSYAFENNLLAQSYIMECARKSFEKKQLIELKPITQF